MPFLYLSLPLVEYFLRRPCHHLTNDFVADCCLFKILLLYCGNRFFFIVMKLAKFCLYAASAMNKLSLWVVSSNYYAPATLVLDVLLLRYPTTARVFKRRRHFYYLLWIKFVQKSEIIRVVPLIRDCIFSSRINRTPIRTSFSCHRPAFWGNYFF